MRGQQLENMIEEFKVSGLKIEYVGYSLPTAF
jgi:hypothetical protein